MIEKVVYYIIWKTLYYIVLYSLSEIKNSSSMYNLVDNGVATNCL